MINFKISEVDWEKYEYPGFEVGDTISDKVTGQRFRCKEVATVKDLKLEEEDIPEYYKFIAIDNPLGNLSTIWVNPELFELVQKKGKSLLGEYKSYAQIREEAGLPPLRPMNPLDAIFNGDEEEPELTEEEENELIEAQEAIDNQRAGRAEFVEAGGAPRPNFAWQNGHVVDLNAQPQAVPPRRNWPLFGEPGEHLRNAEGLFIRDEQGLAILQPNAFVNPAAEVAQPRNDDPGLGQRIVRAPNPWEDQPIQQVNVVREIEGQIPAPEQLMQEPGNRDVFVNAAGDRFIRQMNGNLVPLPRRVVANPDDEWAARMRARAAEIMEENRARQEEQANALRQAAERVNPHRRR